MSLVSERIQRVTALAATVVTVAGLVLAAATITLVLSGHELLVVRSGSMAPTIDVGALAVAREVDAGSVSPGDVVTVRDADGARITHRVVAVRAFGDRVALTLRGDANPAADPAPYVADTVWVTRWTVPLLGYVVAVGTSPPGMLVVGCALAFLLVRPVVPAGRGSRGSGRHRGLPVARGLGTTRAVLAIATSIILVGVAHAAEGVVSTWAAFTDSGTVATAGFSAMTVGAPTGVVCVQNGNQDYLSWTAPSGPAPTAYRIHVNGSATATAQVGPTPLQWRPSSTLFSQTYSNVRVVAVRGAWTSSPSATSDSISTLFLFQGTSC